MDGAKQMVEALLNAGYNVVATSRSVTQAWAASSNRVLVAGDIGTRDTAAKVVAAAMENFTTDDFNSLVSTNLLGFLYITQLAVEQMLKQRAGAIVSITVRSPINRSQE
jgi:NAD(P)-dependent dehydrogenase (short-subunit alcohol dehydrogenase family)